MAELPTEALYDLTVPTDVAVSPDGDRVAFVATEFAPDEDERLSSVFVVPPDGSREPHRLTRASGASNPRWSPDGSRLGVVMARDTDAELRVGRDEDDSEVRDDEDGDEDGDDEDEADESAGGDEPKPQVWVYPDEHHNVGDPDLATHRLETIDDWLARFDPERDGEDAADGGSVENSSGGE